MSLWMVRSSGGCSGIHDQTPTPMMMKLLPKAIKRISLLSPPLTNYHIKTRRFIRRFHLTISPHQSSTRLDHPMGLLRRHETPDPLLPPGIFKPEDLNQSPEDLFRPFLGTPESPSSPLYHVNDLTKTLIYIDGASFNNGSPHARAGCGVYRSPNELLNICRPLPIGTTNNRAELWAAVCALELIARKLTAAEAATSPTGVCEDGGSGGGAVNSWIIASDSNYVVTGATDWAWKRRAVGWKRKKNASKVEGIELSEDWMLGKGLVPNADLWDRLLRGILDVQGQILLWLIPREWNRADGLAKRGAKLDFTLGDDRGLCAPMILGIPSGLAASLRPQPASTTPASLPPALPQPAEPEEGKKEDTTAALLGEENVPRAQFDKLPDPPMDSSE
ncbi:ribonuclease H-like domain-containing protein [Tuber brumale]|nr:ribonuclease H-like domain-containing protein [Tuber brumale]